MTNKSNTTDLTSENLNEGFIHAGAALWRLIEAQGEAAAFLPENAHLVRELAYCCPPSMERQTFYFLLELHLVEGKNLSEVAEEVHRILSFRACTYGVVAATLDAHGLDDWVTLEECVERLQSITSLAPAERDALICQAQEAERHKNYTESSYLMKFIVAQQGKDALALPEHTALLDKLVLNAPPELIDAIGHDADAMGLLPPTTHVEANGQPVYSLEQMAEHLGTTVQEIEETLQERPELQGKLKSGPVFPLQ